MESTINDDFIYRLAGDVETVDHLDALGIALGFGRAAMTRFHTTNNLSGSISCKGTRDMLTEWRQHTPGADKAKLKMALQKAGLIELSERYFQGVHLAGPQENFDVEELRRRLKNYYKQELCHLPLRPWDRDSALSFQRHFVDVDLYEQSQRHKRPEDGRSLNDVLKMACDDQDCRFRYAVLANAGHGKSMLATKIAYDWSHEIEGSPLRRILLLFVITMRLLQENTSLEDAVVSQLLVGEEKYSADVLKMFIEKNQNKCMLVFDGCDEYVANILAKGKKSTIVSVIQNLYLQECPTILTSRYCHQRSFAKASQSYVKMELRGFTLDNVKRYIKGFFHEHAESGEKLWQFLENRPVVCQLVQIPLFCVMVCDLWLQDALEDVQTQTGLLNQVIQYLWQHLRAKTESSTEEESSYSSDEKESAYDSDGGEPQELEMLLLKLGQVILELHLEDSTRTIFSKKDFKEVAEELKKACEMGLMLQKTVTETRIKKDRRTQRTEIKFYHKLAQEHIASYYLVSLPPTRVEETLSRIKDYKDIHRYENLLRFMCGYGSNSCTQVLGHLLKQLWLDQPLPPNKNVTFRLALDFLNECPELSDTIRRHLDTIFQERYLCLHAATPNAVLGLQKLPQGIKDKIFMIRIQSMDLSDCSCREFCNVLPSFRGLNHLGLRGVSASEASLVSIVESARRIRHMKGVIFLDPQILPKRLLKVMLYLYGLTSRYSMGAVFTGAYAIEPEKEQCLFRYCYTSEEGTLHKFLQESDVAVSEGNMRVLVSINKAESEGRYYITHTR